MKNHFRSPWSREGSRLPSQVNFGGPPTVVVNNFSCPLVSGTGIKGTEDFGVIGGVCSFNQTTTNLPEPMVVTITGCTIAELGTGTRVYASLWFGLPGVVLLGSFRRSGERFLRVLALLLPISILLIGMGLRRSRTNDAVRVVPGSGAGYRSRWNRLFGSDSRDCHAIGSIKHGSLRRCRLYQELRVRKSHRLAVALILLIGASTCSRTVFARRRSQRADTPTSTSTPICPRSPART